MTTQNKNNITINEIMQNPIFQEFCMLRNLKHSSTKTYATAIRAYLLSQQKSLEDLIEEADEEEEQGIRMKKRKIKQRLIQFKQYLQEHNYQPQTINNYIHKVRTFYYQFDITAEKLPNNKVKKKSYADAITKEHITTAIESSNSSKMKALILFMCSSGNAAQETANITIQDFIDATSDYHNEVGIEHVISSLINRKDIIPTFTIRRQKTGVPYTSFCSPEATHYILLYLKERLIHKGLTPDERLFDLSSPAIGTRFRRLNDRLGWGYVDTHRFFHSHGLRGFFATSMVSNGVSELTVDFWEGRTVTGTHAAYFNPNPEQLKKRYIAAMDCVTIFEDVVYHDINSEERLELEQLRKNDIERERELADIRRRLEALDLSKLGV